ncbi:glycoside hydrolase family 43 protein [Paenibacillus sp. TRM 82003]|nr:glycoside hydrolase family 43 protein [Paenibacillus sp. TRM 82003]
MIAKDQIQMRDPFVLRVDAEGFYYLYGSTDKNIWTGPGTGFDVYRSKDLEAWEGPFPAFRPEPEFWADTNYWAPEVHAYRGKYYMFATFKTEGVRRGTQILIADHPIGPFRPHSDGPVTPRDWECLDGTLFVDDAGQPWMVFCHEWVQISDGTVEAIRLSETLDRAVGEPKTLFAASSAAWVEPVKSAKHGDGFVTDGPFLRRGRDGSLLMLWSSFKGGQYAQAIARSTSGGVEGPWVQEAAPLFESDGGHGMIFETFEGKLKLALHTPNKSPNERPIFIDLAEESGRLVAEAQ